MSRIILAFFDWSFVVGVFVGRMELIFGCLSLNLFFSLSRMTNYEGLALETSSFVLSSWWKFYAYKLIWNHREDQSALVVYYFSSHSPLPGVFLAIFMHLYMLRGRRLGMGGGIDLASFFLFRWPTLVALTVIKITNSLPWTKTTHTLPWTKTSSKKIESKMFNIHIQICLLL